MSNTNFGIPTTDGMPVVIDRQRAVVTVTPTEEGWKILGESKIRKVIGQAATFTAEIKACDCQLPDCTCGNAGERKSHKGTLMCHGWHAGRVLKLAQAIAGSYL